MRFVPAPSGVLPPTVHGPHGRLARWAVGLCVLGGAAIASSVAAFAGAYALEGASATEDTWVAYLVASMALAGLLGSFAAFVLALVAKARRERWSLLWLPFVTFPAFVLFLVLGEAFWWE